MEKKRVVIVGGGASGLTAALFAAREGAAVTILEQNEKPGRKICATGNGKCNLTNLLTKEDAYRGSLADFHTTAISQFSPDDTLWFFAGLGIYSTNRNNYIYPRSGQAQSVVDVLVMEARHLGIKIKTNEKVTKIKTDIPDGSPFQVLTEGWHYECDAVILASGSKASAIAGSDGSGYALAESLGHHVIEPLPALTALKCSGKNFKGWAGVRTQGRITLYIDNLPFKKEQGELQLTEYGISGIPVFQLSRYAIRALHENRPVSLKVDFFPDYPEDLLKTYLEKRRSFFTYKNEKEMLTGLFPDKLIKIFCAQPDLVKAIKEFPLHVTSGLSFEQAQVCSGGVDTREVDSDTMESKIISGLYFAGELLDVDGACGGYNLQWAWASGAAAGKHSAKIR